MMMMMTINGHEYYDDDDDPGFKVGGLGIRNNAVGLSFESP